MQQHGESCVYSVKWKRQDIKEFILYDSIYMNFKSRPKKILKDLCSGDKTFWWFAGACNSKEGTPGELLGC